MPINVRQTVSVNKACELVGVSRRTIYNWMSQGKVEFIRTAGQSRRIVLDTLFRNRFGEPMAQTSHIVDTTPVSQG